MNPNTKANQELAAANRELLLSVLEMQLAQNRRSAVTMRSLANSVSGLADEMEAQQEEAENTLSILADQLEQKAETALRQRPKMWLMEAVNGIRNMLNRSNNNGG